jgi:Peptidase A4 family
VRHVRMLGLCLVAALALDAYAVSSASALKWGRCEDAKSGGKYTGPNCSKAEKATSTAPPYATPAERADLQPEPERDSISPSGAVSSFNWSAYAAISSTPFIAVQSTYTQPTVTCTVPWAWVVFWVGFDGYSNGTVEQAGTLAMCSGGTNPVPTYYAWWEMYPTNYIQFMPISVAPGDKIKAKVVYDSSKSSYFLSVRDRSNGQTYSQVTACAAGLTCARQSAEWVVERPASSGSLTALADWDTVKLHGDKAANTVNLSGKPALQPISAFDSTPMDMVNDSWETLASVGDLNKRGTAFWDTWQAAQ